MKKIFLILLCIISAATIFAEIKYKTFPQKDETKYAKEYSVKIKEDKIDKKISYTLNNLLIPEKKAKLEMDIDKLSLNINKTDNKMFFSLSCLNGKFLDIYDIQIYINNKQISAPVTKIGIKKIDGYILEFLTIKDVDSILPEIINSTNVTIRIKSHSYIDIDVPFSEQNFYNFQRFYKEQIDAAR